MSDQRAESSDQPEKQELGGAAQAAAYVFPGQSGPRGGITTGEIRASAAEGTPLPEDDPDLPEDDPDQVTDSTDRITDRPGRVPSGYDPEDAAREDLRVLVAALDEVSDQLAALTDTLQQQLSDVMDRQPDLQEQLDRVEQIAPGVRQLQVTVVEIERRGPGQNPDLALPAAAQSGALTNEAEDANEQFPGTPTWKRIWALLKKATGRLWSLISHLVKVKEWSVTGQVGTSVLGLAQASISVTFGQ